jgi:phosphatidylinositol alpha-1,6-mannosyltransferase
VSEERKQELLLRSRCLALPSRAEGFGLVYAEAMRLGRPCLVSTLDAGREVVSPPHAGLAADPDDRTQLAESVYRLLTLGPEWQAWSEAAQERYRASFTAGHFQDRLLAAIAPVRQPIGA